MAEAEKFPEGGGYHAPRLNQLEIEQTPRITNALLEQGYSDEDVCAILGGNWLRVLAQVWH